jgi:hypothetical protein
MRWARFQQPFDFRLSQHPSSRVSRWAGSLLRLEQLDRVGEDPAAAASEAQHALQGGQGVGRRLRRAPRGAQVGDQTGDIFDPD